MIKLLLILLILVTPTLACAEETGALIPPRIVNLSFIQHDFMEADQVGLQMRIPDVVSGCYELSPIEFETSFIEGNYMDIEVKGYRRTPIKTKDVSFDCNVGAQVVAALIPMSARDFESRHIREVRFKNGKIEDSYSVSISDNSMTLTPKRMVAFKPISPLTHNWSTGGTIALHVPMTQKGEDIAQALQNFAYGKALFPVSNSRIDDNSFRFEDKSGETMSTLGGQNFVEVGTITVNRPYNGGQGLQRLPVPLKVFATLDGKNL